jgi:hypothetical protein
MKRTLQVRQTEPVQQDRVVQCHVREHHSAGCQTQRAQNQVEAHGPSWQTGADGSRMRRSMLPEHRGQGILPRQRAHPPGRGRAPEPRRLPTRQRAALGPRKIDAWVAELLGTPCRDRPESSRSGRTARQAAFQRSPDGRGAPPVLAAVGKRSPAAWSRRPAQAGKRRRRRSPAGPSRKSTRKQQRKSSCRDRFAV